MRAHQLAPIEYEQHEEYLADESTSCRITHLGPAHMWPQELGGLCVTPTAANYRTVCC